MARGEVRYRLTLDSNFKETAEQSADALGKADKATAQWTEEMQRAAMQMAGMHSEALKMNAALNAATQQQEEWGKTNQRAAMRMEAMHEEALKLNNAFKSGSDETQRNAETLRAFDQATGGAISSTQGLSSTLDLANVGWKNLNTTSAGFNAQSAGVVGAGLAIGTAIGSWLNTFPAVQHAVDSLRDSLIELMTQGLVTTPAQDMEEAMKGLGEFSAKMAKSNDEAVARQIDGLKRQGLSIEQIDDMYRKHDPVARTAIDRLHQERLARDEAAKATKKHADEAEAAAKKLAAIGTETRKQLEANRAEEEKFVNDMNAKGEKALDDIAAAHKRIIDGMKERDAQWLAARIKGIEESREAQRKLFEDAEKGFEEQSKAMEEAHRQELDDLQSIADMFHQIGGKGFGMLGDMLDGVVSIEHSIDKWNTAGKGFGGTLSKISAGMGIASAAFGIGKSLMGALGIGGNKEHMQVNDMRDEFIKAAGGLDVLNQKAHAAGLTLNDLLNAKKVGDYNAAVDKLNLAFDAQGRAQSALQAAQEKYQVGWSQLDQTAGELLRDQNLLIAAGFSQQEVANGMADAYSDYVQQVIESGGTIPEAMRSTIQLLQEQGKLVDENGDAYDDATIKGLNFTEKLTDQMSKLVDEIHRMVNALLGINDVDIDVGVRSHNVTGGNERPVRFEEENSFAEGTGGFRDFGSGTPAMLHGTEAVVRPIDLARMVRGGGGGTTVVRLSLGNREFGQAVAQTAGSGRMRPKQQLRRGLH